MTGKRQILLSLEGQEERPGEMQAGHPHFHSREIYEVTPPVRHVQMHKEDEGDREQSSQMCQG